MVRTSRRRKREGGEGRQKTENEGRKEDVERDNNLAKPTSQTLSVFASRLTWKPVLK